MSGAPGGLRFAVLGDSLSEGVGDPLPGSGWRGWAALLADGLGADVRLLNAARSGARSSDAAGPQLAAALGCRPHLAAVVAGGNDTLRGDFDIAVVAADLHRAIGALRAADAQVLTACLPDPGGVLGLPWPLARPLARRMASVNRAVHALSAHHGALHLHVARLPWTTAPGVLSADRLHPSETGHRMMAREFHALLAAAGLPVGTAPDAEPDGPPPGRAASWWWTATRGTRWVAARCTDLVPELAALAAAECRARARGADARLDLAASRATERALAALGVPVAAGVRAGEAAVTGEAASAGESPAPASAAMRTARRPAGRGPHGRPPVPARAAARTAGHTAAYGRAADPGVRENA